MTSQPLSTLQQLLEQKTGPDRYYVFFLKRTCLGNLASEQDRQTPQILHSSLALSCEGSVFPTFEQREETNGMTWLNLRRTTDTGGQRIVSTHSQSFRTAPPTSQKVPLCSSFSMQARILHRLFKTQRLQNNINAPFAPLKPQDTLNLRQRGKTT